MIDTNIVIETLGDDMPLKVKQFVVGLTPTISVVTHIETLGWYNATPKQLSPVIAFMDVATVLPLDKAIVEKTISIRQQKKIRLGDAIIAATTLVYDLTLVTRNIADFKNIEGLQVLDPYSL